MRTTVRLLVVFIWAILSSCSSSPSLDQMLEISEQDIQTSSDLERLKRQYQKLATRLAEEDRKDLPTEFALLDSTGKRIVTLQNKQLEKVLDEKRIAADGDTQNRVPLPALAQIKRQLEDDETLAASLLPEVSTPILREEAATANLIQKMETEANRQDLTAERRATLYHQLYIASGEEKWKDIRDKQMDIIIKAIHAAAEKNNFSKSLEEKMDFVRGIYVEKPEKIVEDIRNLYADMYVHRYTRMRANGDLEGAFQTLQNLSRKEDYLNIRKHLGARAADIAAHYASYVSDSVTRGWRLTDTFANIERERTVRTLLGLQPATHLDLPKFVQQLAEKVENIKNSDPYAALGLLLAEKTVDPDAHGLEFSLDQQLASVAGNTIKSISVEKFRSRYQELNYGDVVTPLIGQQLLDSIGDNIKVVEGDGANLTDATVIGTVLEVKVENTQTRNKKQMMVNVGEVQRTNPAYIAWLELPPKERKNIAKPDETLKEQKQENIFVTSTLHRKTGVFAVSYRLMDNRNGRVIFPDSITLQAEYEDESNEGLEVGELVIPYKLAKLPTDTEILQQLAQNVAQTIAGNLAGVLQNQEIELVKAADKSATQGMCKEEVENLAKAVALIAKKGREDAAAKQLNERLVHRTLECL